MKDKIATHWISILIEKARQLQQDRLFSPSTRDARLEKLKGPPREALKSAIKAEIQQDLYTWLLSQPSGDKCVLESETEGRFRSLFCS